MTSLNSTTSTSVEETTGTKNEADSNAPLKPLVITVDEELILERANFYRSSYERSFKIMAISLIVNVVLAISLVIFLLNPEEPRYFSTEKGIITPITPINQGLNRESDVINWASKTISHIYTFSHATMKSTIAEAKDDFTDQGYNSYVKAFIASGNDKNIVENKYSVTAVPKETPIITAAQVVDGVFFTRCVTT